MQSDKQMKFQSQLRVNLQFLQTSTPDSVQAYQSAHNCNNLCQRKMHQLYLIQDRHVPWVTHQLVSKFEVYCAVIHRVESYKPFRFLASINLYPKHPHRRGHNSPYPINPAMYSSDIPLSTTLKLCLHASLYVVSIIFPTLNMPRPLQ